MKAKRILASVLSVALLLQLSPLGVLALDESLPQTPQVSTVQENLDPVPHGRTCSHGRAYPGGNGCANGSTDPGAHGRAYRHTGGGACAGRCGNACPGAVCGTHGNP